MNALQSGESDTEQKNQKEPDENQKELNDSVSHNDVILKNLDHLYAPTREIIKVIYILFVGIIAYVTVYYSMDIERMVLLIYVVLIVIFSIEIFDSVKQGIIGSYNLKTIGILLVILHLSQ
jgi:hypothetical protein